MSFLNEKTVLVLNALYQIIGVSTPRNVLIALNSGMGDEDIAAKAIDVVYQRGGDGLIDLNTLDYWMPLTFDEWIMTEPRGNIDKVIHSPRLSFRCPTVIVAVNHKKVPMRKFHPTKTVLYDLQDGVCGLTNKKISLKQGNLEHKIPRSKGGKNTFENLMFVDKHINSKRGDKPYKELGLDPLFHHKQPNPIPVSFTIKNHLHPDWKWFIPN